VSARSIVAAAFLLALSVVGTAAEPRDKIVVAIAGDTMSYLPVYIAKQKHYFEDYGIDGDYLVTHGGVTGVASVIAGGTQVYLGPPSIAMKAVKRGQALEAYGALMIAAPMSCVLQKGVADARHVGPDMPVEDRIRAFKGLTFGINAAGSAPDAVLRYSLIKVGLAPDKDVTISPVGAESAAEIAAFAQKRIDGICMSSPIPDVSADKYGGVRVVDYTAGEFPPLRGFLYLSLISRSDWLAENPDRARRVVQAFAKAMRLIREHPDEAHAVGRTVFPAVDESTFELMFAANMRTFSPTMHIDPHAIEQAREFIKTVDHIDYDGDLGKIYTNAYSDPLP
jgi:NitT/TauT family transport system substrate-binding protein